MGHPCTTRRPTNVLGEEEPEPLWFTITLAVLVLCCVVWATYKMCTWRRPPKYDGILVRIGRVQPDPVPTPVPEPDPDPVPTPVPEPDPDPVPTAIGNDEIWLEISI